MNKRAKLTMASAMTIFGTVGIFRRYIPLSSSLVSFVRGLIGTLILILFVLLSKKKLSKEAVKSNLIKLLVSGALIGRADVHDAVRVDIEGDLDLRF